MISHNLSPKSDQLLANTYRKDLNGWIFLHIEGKPYDRGFQHGYLLAKEITEAIRVIKYLIYFDTGETFDVFVHAALTMFPKHIDEEYLNEMQGIADGAVQAGYTIKFEEILAWNAYPELICNWWPQSKNQQPVHLKRAHKCSAFVGSGSATRHGDVVMAHTTWQLYAASDWYNVVLEIFPEQGNRMVMQSVPGYIGSSTDFWVSGAGLMITETSIVGFSGFDATKAPEFFRARKATQYASTIEEWKEIMLCNNNGGYANIWLLGDCNTGEIARFELGLKYFGFDKKSEGCFAGYNAPTNIELRNIECTGTGYGDIRNNGARQVRWQKLFEKNDGKIDAALAKEMIADHFDVYTQKENPCSRTICGHFELDNAADGADTPPFFPWGSADAKVTNSSMAKALQFEARWGHACGLPFDATRFLQDNIQYDWLQGYLKDRPSQPWTSFGV